MKTFKNRKFFWASLLLVLAFAYRPSQSARASASVVQCVPNQNPVAVQTSYTTDCNMRIGVTSSHPGWRVGDTLTLSIQVASGSTPGTTDAANPITLALIPGATWQDRLVQNGPFTSFTLADYWSCSGIVCTATQDYPVSDQNATSQPAISNALTATVKNKACVQANITAHVESSRGGDSSFSVNCEHGTAIDLVDFSAEITPPNNIKLSWETASEWDHVGFNVYRSIDQDKLGSQVNADLIGTNGTLGQGSLYTLQDNELATGTYWYTLEDVDVDGVQTQHPAISVTVTSPIALAISLHNAQAGGSTQFVSMLSSLLGLLLTGLTIQVLQNQHRIGALNVRSDQDY